MAARDNIKVAVRVRPFIEREKSRESKLIIAMKDNVTSIVNPNDKTVKNFSFDFSYWSHDAFTCRDDGFRVPSSKSSQYVDQDKVFNDLGRGMLDHAWKGYNSSIFAYGQTGSGKSYSIVGDQVNKGLVPRTCAQLFTEINDKKKPGVVFEVSFSMVEIYNEQIRDLLSKHNAPPGGLKIRDSVERGFYVESLQSVTVGNYEDVAQRINEGNRKRTIAATKMNDTSSRAHTIVTLAFTQNDTKQRTTIQSNIILVDLAGSERQKQTESEGERFKEATNINQSLSTLGNVINALVKMAKDKSVHVPYRDSVLTKLLKNALGGNSKTVMIAALSPDAENYDQTLSTLQYADRVKQIQTDARVNKVDTSKLMEALIADKKKLLIELEKAKMSGNYTEEDIQRMKDEQRQELKAYEDKLANMEKAVEQRLAAARKEMEARQAAEREQEEALKKIPHLSNLNEDAALCDKLRHLCQPGVVALGRGNQGSQNVSLAGPGIVAQHAEIRNKNGEVSLVPINGSILHNGKELTQAVVLNHGDRIRFGANNLYVFRHPLQAEEARKKKKSLRIFTYEDAQEEIAKYSGLDFSQEDKLLQDEVISVLPMVQSINAMAKEMNKPVTFDMLLVSPEARGLDSGRTELYVRLTDEEAESEYLWTKRQFLNRQSYVQEMYQKFEETGEVPQVVQSEDPFWEPPELDVIIGVASLPLQFLSYMIEFKEDPLTVLDYTAQQCGFLEVQLIPCDRKGNEGSDFAVDDPYDLVAKPVSFKIKILQALNIPARFSSTYCKYRFYTSAESVKTCEKPGPNPKYNHEEVITIPKVDHKLVDYLKDKSMAIEIWGKQNIRKQSAKSSRGGMQRQTASTTVSDLQKTINSLERKLEQIKKIVDRMPSKSAERAELLKVLGQ